MPKSKKRRGGFLEGFRLDDAYLRKPDRKAGRAGLLTGFDPDGDSVLVKIWPRQSGVHDDDLQEIWHHELRQLHRLGGYPGASDAIAPLHQAGSDNEGFYLVLKPGPRRPLATFVERLGSGHWLANQRLPSNRAKLWRNLQKVVRGLELLHGQGLIHRNIDDWAILTAGADDPDFQLTGFEWSLRLVGITQNTKSPRKSVEDVTETASFLQDWRSLGLLMANLMDVNLRRLEDPSIPLSGVSEHLSVEEVRLLRNLTRAEPLDRLDGEVIDARISSALRNLEAEIAGRDPKLYIVARLGTGSLLSESIHEVIDGDIEVSEINKQVMAIEDDLSDSPLLLAVKLPSQSDFRLLLQGKKLLYSLTSYVNRQSPTTPTWELSECDRAERANPATPNLLGQIALQPNSIEVMTAREASDRFSRLRGRLTSWASLRRQFEDKSATPTREKRLHQALALTQFLEALFAAADAYPVSVVNEEDDQHENMTILSVRSREDPERDALSAALDLRSPNRRFHEVLRDERRTDEWVLSEARQVGERHIDDTAWRFIDAQERSGFPTIYRFSGPIRPPSLTTPVLIPADFVGRDIQFRRRLKALRSLADHAELLKMLVSPRLRILDTHEKVNRDKAFEDLDASKQEAFVAITGTIPLFLVQGPPGVGKTRLVRDLVKATFHHDMSARLLVSAQSNAAVDHLLAELHEVLTTESSDVLIVRSRPSDTNEDAGPYELRRQTENVLTRLANSELVVNAPAALREAVHRLASERGTQVTDASSKVQIRYARPAFEGLIVRAANVVFATTNSFELERLIDDRSQFDWAIVEEAGKATGGELIPPLLLSHRRLMIGDHKQLSPFNAETIIRLLEKPEKVREALQTGQEFISRALRDPSTDEVLDELESAEADFPPLCTLAIDVVLLFEHLIEAEFKLQARRGDIRPIAHRLTEQHRMHPALARIVSKAFYENELKSHERTVARYEKETCPIISIDHNRLPAAPLVVIDMPYIQKSIGLKGAEREPRWHNPEELGAVAKVLELLDATSSDNKLPSLAILSPYSEQVRRLKRRIDENVSSFPRLSKFRPAVSSSSYCGTVDSFQGNEADIVIVSLVRNNHHTGVRSALGFLSDARRMNVLLSRARWRMVLVGSLDFLRQILQSSRQTEAGVDLAFLERLLSAIIDEEDIKTAVVTPLKRLLGEARQ